MLGEDNLKMIEKDQEILTFWSTLFNYFVLDFFIILKIIIRLYILSYFYLKYHIFEIKLRAFIADFRFKLT